MTANEMRNLFKELYDGASAQEMGYDDKEVSRFLNLAQDLILNEKFFALRNRLREGFEASSKRDVELNNLKRNLSLWYNINTSQWRYHGYLGSWTVNVTEENSNVYPLNSVIIDLDNSVLFILQDTVDIKQNDELIRNIPVKNIDEDNINDIMNNPFKKPDETVIYRTTFRYDIEDEYRRVRLILPTGYKLNRWNLSYLKRPIRIRVDIINPINQRNCELDSIIHNDIVFKAVELALGSIGSQKIQIAATNSLKNIN